ncbi:MAG: hypothetical protein R6X35_03475 [Candidatus Krumholzibacteriia bacterium]
MRWLDIYLPDPADSPVLAAACRQARTLAADLPAIQERDGLDAVGVTARMAEVGMTLCQAIGAVRPQAFAPTADAGGDATTTPPLGDPDHDGLLGYHLVVAPALLDLPWNWLHTGLGFVLEHHPLAWGTRAAGAARRRPARPWFERMQRARYLVGDAGEAGLPATLAHLRAGVARPEVLFVAGHSEEVVRRLIHREGEAVAAALADRRWGEPLAALDLPAATPTPGRLAEQALLYQAIHYAGPVSCPARLADAGAAPWLDQLVLDAVGEPDEEFERELGLEGKLVGVDQVTALLDSVAEGWERPAAATLRAAGAAGPRAGGPSWLLDDGPVPPEQFGRGPGLPPLVFSNSHRALPELGARFLAAGASTFIGPVAPLYSRPARLYAGACWGALAAGWCAGAAAWRAAGDLRRDLGPEHPAWLSYGVQGSGLLALQYL